jgi:hypothetical protein
LSGTKNGTNSTAASVLDDDGANDTFPAPNPVLNVPKKVVVPRAACSGTTAGEADAGPVDRANEAPTAAHERADAASSRLLDVADIGNSFEIT